MARTIRLPEALDGATLSWAAPAGSAVRASQPVATFDADGKNVPVMADADAVVWRVLPHTGQPCGAGAPIVVLAAPDEAVGYDPAVVQCVRAMVLRKCDECGNDYPVNGLVDSVRCTRCGDDQRAPAAFWRAYLGEDAQKARAPGVAAGGSVLGGRHGACTLQLWGVPPLCRKCYALIDWSSIVEAWDRAAKSGPTSIHCTSCGEAHRARVPPPWAVEVFPGVALLVGETATEARGSPGGDEDGPRPVVFKCPSCMAALKIDGVRRIVHCTFCDSDVYLPDDLWLHFNPATKRGRWWMLFRST